MPDAAREPLPTWQAPTPADLVALARARFLKRERIDLQTLADELGISRATAYRWAGNADALVGEVIASIVEDTFRRLAEETRALRGAARVMEMVRRGMRYILAFVPMREYLEKDPQRGLRLIASKDGPVQQRTIALYEQLFADEVARGHMTLPVDTHTMAYAMTRIAESFLYADLIAGEKPDVEKAGKILELLLQQDRAAPRAAKPAARRRTRPA